MEIGVTYYLEFQNGDRAFFVPESLCKNGSYKGKAWDHYVGRRKPTKPKQYFVNWTHDWKKL